MIKFKISVRAKQDLKNIAVFTQSKWGSEQRNIYLTQFDQVSRLLANKPTLGEPCEEIAKDYFKYPQDSHVIFLKKVNCFLSLFHFLLGFLYTRLSHFFAPMSLPTKPIGINPINIYVVISGAYFPESIIGKAISVKNIGTQIIIANA